MTNPFWLSALLAGIPLIWLLIGLGWLKMTAARASLIGLGAAVLISVLFFRMDILSMLQAALEGVVLAFLPILWAIIGAIYAYNIGVHTGSIEKIKAMLSGISKDRRVQVLILAWAFSGFMEGAAGYGTAVAIPASILVALGFEPLFAAVICLIGNTAPTAFGAIGIPVITLAKLTDYNITAISTDVVLQLTPLIILLPFAMVLMTSGKGEGLKGVWGVTLVAGISFALVHYLAARFIGPELPALLGGIASLAAIILWLRISGRTGKGRTPAETYGENEQGITLPAETVSLKDGLVAWSPYIFLFVIILLTSSMVPPVNAVLERFHSEVLFYTGTGGKPMVIHWILTPGTLIFISAILGGLLQGASLAELAGVFTETVKQLTKTIVTVSAIVATAKIMGYSGMVNEIALAISGATGRLYPLISPFIGALGTFLTGSDTSANVLFAQLQKQTAEQLGLNAQWIAAANTAGASGGKMLSPQNITIAATSTGLLGKEGEILNRAMKVCAVYVIILGVLLFFTS